MIQTIKDTVFVPIQPAGWPFIAIAAAVTLVLFAIAQPLGWIGLAITGWCTFFFRDPDRQTPVREGLVVSPADGLVQSVSAAVPPPELGLGEIALPRVSVFMNVFDVHVNRIPVDGTIRRIAYVAGAFVNAVQIAGLVARRIVCWVSEGERVRTGQRLGMIRFGSRVDVYLPAGVAPLVGPGQRMIAGETVIADLSSPEPARLTEAR